MSSLLRSRLQAAATRVCASSIARSANSRFASTTRFTKEHEYARVDGGVATCGVTDYAQSALGDVVYVSLPAVGTKVKKGEAIAGVESVKAASDVYAPVSGTVTEANKAVADSPAMVNSGAEGNAWFVKIAMSDEKELAAMMDKAAYDKHVAASKH